MPTARTRDLPGQALLFPEGGRADAAADFFCTGRPARSRPDPCAPRALSLPPKPTCTAREAAEATGISERQIRYWVEDGTLLAINSARCPVGPRGDRKSVVDRWRVVVRRGPDFAAPEMRAFLTLEELLKKGSNMEAQNYG